MEDIFGNIVTPGDKIVFSKQIPTGRGRYNSLGRSPLITGIVDKIMAHDTVAVVRMNDANGNFVRNLQLKKENILRYDWMKTVD